MRALSRFLVHLALNGLALWLVAAYLPGISFTGGLRDLALLAFIFMVLNATLKPILTLLFGPLIILTLGLALLIVNAIVLAVLDKLFQNLSIDNVFSLLLATTVIGIVNIIFHLGTSRS